VPYTRRFIIWWTGLRENQACRALDSLTERRYLVQVDVDEKGNPLYVHRQGAH